MNKDAQLIDSVLFKSFVLEAKKLWKVLERSYNTNNLKHLDYAQYAMVVTFQQTTHPTRTIVAEKQKCFEKHKLYVYNLKLPILLICSWVGITKNDSGLVFNLAIFWRNK